MSLDENLEIDAANMERFFGESTAPSTLAADTKRLHEFLHEASARKAKIVCITSGGTTVPLEKNTVRFLDNFSTGNRGAKSAEMFLHEGYYVVFLNRTGSAQPFARSFQEHLAPTFNLDFMSHLESSPVRDTLCLNLGNCEQEHKQKLFEAVDKYTEYKKKLLSVEFVTLVDYMHKLKAIACSSEGHSILFILAAAVSDFYIPDKKMIKHKIQSREGPLQLELSQVPKALGVLRRNWAPTSMFVSFKLETDHDILLKKARSSIAKYGMHCVVANELHSRYEELFLVTQSEELKVKKGDSPEIEEKLALALIKMHNGFLKTGKIAFEA